MAASEETFDALVAEEQLADPSSRAEWQRLTPAREFAATLLRYRAEHKLGQRALAKELGILSRVSSSWSLVSTTRRSTRSSTRYGGSESSLHLMWLRQAESRRS